MEGLNRALREAELAVNALVAPEGIQINLACGGEYTDRLIVGCPLGDFCVGIGILVVDGSHLGLLQAKHVRQAIDRLGWAVGPS